MRARDLSQMLATDLITFPMRSSGGIHKSWDSVDHVTVDVNGVDVWHIYLDTGGAYYRTATHILIDPDLA